VCAIGDPAIIPEPHLNVRFHEEIDLPRRQLDASRVQFTECLDSIHRETTSEVLIAEQPGHDDADGVVRHFLCASRMDGRCKVALHEGFSKRDANVDRGTARVWRVDSQRALHGVLASEQSVRFSVHYDLPLAAESATMPPALP
jgi:hypothetical protein